MIEIAQLLIGGFWMASLSVTSWLIGLLMGVGLAKLTAGVRAPRADVDELLRRDRVKAEATAQRASALAANATGKSGRAE
jgi:hypothetical protein